MNSVKYLYPQTELTDLVVALLARSARQLAGNPRVAEVFIRPETYQDTTPWGTRVQKTRLEVHLEYQEPGCFPARIEFLAVRCSNCGRLILHYPDAEPTCPYKGCDRYAARLLKSSSPHRVFL